MAFENPTYAKSDQTESVDIQLDSPSPHFGRFIEYYNPWVKNTEKKFKGKCNRANFFPDTMLHVFPGMEVVTFAL